MMSAEGRKQGAFKQQRINKMKKDLLRHCWFKSSEKRAEQILFNSATCWHEIFTSAGARLYDGRHFKKQGRRYCSSLHGKSKQTTTRECSLHSYRSLANACAPETQSFVLFIPSDL
jgi:hypothetical protein